MLMSSKPRPTTTRPMTAPARKATWRPRFKDSLAAWAVRLEASVAVFIPMKPQRPLKKPPVRKANGTRTCCCFRPNACQTSSNTSTRNAIATTTYCRLR